MSRTAAVVGYHNYRVVKKKNDRSSLIYFRVRTPLENHRGNVSLGISLNHVQPPGKLYGTGKLLNASVLLETRYFVNLKLCIVHHNMFHKNK